MNTMLIEVVNPNAMRLLYHLEELNLIKVLREDIDDKPQPQKEDKEASASDSADQI